MTRKEAEQFIADLKTLREEATDKQASLATSVYPALKQDGALVEAGTRILHNGKLYKAAVDLWDTEENNPDNAPDLWAELQYKNGIRIIPEQIDVTTLFALDELGWWGDVLYRSKADNNAYTPEQYPDNWALVSNET